MPYRCRAKAAHVFLFGLLLCPLALGSCNQFSRIGECKKFVDLANTNVAEWTQLHERNQPTPQADIYETLATEFKDAGKTFADLTLKDPQLKQAVKGYTTILDHSAKHAKSYAKTLRALTKAADGKNDKGEKKATKELKKLRGEMKKILRSHKSGMSRINALCQPKR